MKLVMMTIGGAAIISISACAQPEPIAAYDVPYTGKYDAATETSPRPKPRGEVFLTCENAAGRFYKPGHSILCEEDDDPATDDGTSVPDGGDDTPPVDGCLVSVCGPPVGGDGDNDDHGDDDAGDDGEDEGDEKGPKKDKSDNSDANGKGGNKHDRDDKDDKDAHEKAEDKKGV